jgi:hypothetical protein
VIRTDGVGSSLRIEAIGKSVVAYDPSKDEKSKDAKCTITTNADWGALEDRVWNQLRFISAESPSKLELSEDSARKLLCQFYRAGLDALLAFMGPRHFPSLGDIQAFFRARIPRLPRANEEPPIIDIIGDDDDHHLPLEFLPVLGRADACSTDVGTARDIADVLPGYCAVIRRFQLGDDPHPERSDKRLYHDKLAIRFFRHADLAGVHQEIRCLGDLEKEGRLALKLVFPPKGYRSSRAWPERELARIMASPYGEDEAGTRASHVCHFSCHLLQGGRGGYLEMRPDGLSRKSQYRLNDLMAARGDLDPLAPGVPVLFLGTCRSGVPDPVLRTKAVDVCRYFYPRCLIGTLADVPDLVAADFCVECYRELANGSCVGAVLRATRLKLLEASRNPFGLLFTSYYGEDTYIPSRQDRRAQYIPPESRTIIGAARRRTA